MTRAGAAWILVLANLRFASPLCVSTSPPLHQDAKTGRVRESLHHEVLALVLMVSYCFKKISSNVGPGDSIFQARVLITQSVLLTSQNDVSVRASSHCAGMH
jgi:flagellar biogenesis protein FliO